MGKKLIASIGLGPIVHNKIIELKVKIISETLCKIWKNAMCKREIVTGAGIVTGIVRIKNSTRL